VRQQVEALRQQDYIIDETHKKPENVECSSGWHYLELHKICQKICQPENYASHECGSKMIKIQQVNGIPRGAFSKLMQCTW
jgi:hypothetical protein